MFNRSISRKLALTFAVVTLCIALAYALCLRESLRESLNKQMHNELMFRYSLVEPLIVSKFNHHELDELKTKLMSLSNSEGGRVHYWILSSDPALQVGGEPPKEIDLNALTDGFSRVNRDKTDQCPLFILTKTIRYRDGVTPLHFVVSIDSTPYMGTLNEFTQVLIFITTMGVLFVTFLGFVISRQGMQPVELLSQQARELAPGIDGQRLDASALPQELQGLAEAFNGVLARQQTAWRQLESFNADVAHELRTPLSSILGQTQLALSRKRSHEELEACLESNLEEVNRMTSIVNDMLFLSHAQTGKHPAQLAEVSLREEALKTAEYTEPSFTDRHLQLLIEGDVQICVDRRLFTRSLANLLENSARYAYENSQVTVTLTSNDQHATVSVKNYGDAIESHHLERLFERFYRADHARTQSDTNHGLGLSIVKAVAQMHGGDVFATSLNGENTFGFTLALKK
ncbi:heavy metal sensor histidine kinase [Kosakonia pseudosacchari]|uniref:Sensor protein n=1 Tax=Kosakonia pseudosacchari TaxID=1646340 RepID=A0ABX4IL74_9ENTR|nr:heavy metal sensor histidine kinase [Kosakonia pseudosacchari]PDO84196.1 two-component sensor histidine kinase [Kosakonia pseudosacchari]